MKNVTALASHEGDGTCLPFKQELGAAEMLTDELKGFLVRYGTALEHEGIHRQVALIKQWVESYRYGLLAADKLSVTGLDLLTNLRERLKLASDELHRLESEGGNLTHSSDITEADELRKAMLKLDKLIPSLEHMVHKDEWL